MFNSPQQVTSIYQSQQDISKNQRLSPFQRILQQNELIQYNVPAKQVQFLLEKDLQISEIEKLFHFIYQYPLNEEEIKRYKEKQEESFFITQNQLQQFLQETIPKYNSGQAQIIDQIDQKINNIYNQENLIYNIDLEYMDNPSLLTQSQKDKESRQ
ncbi:hypothetical protein PPERSA_07855 [Pseudocohnilembus persalinus]|uniref:Uncharacterized protein n=1 Tax=Pseudocohnilembus persalinus TaxID=266149 RepID=A0A0V0QC75_PSEPJ|nr:hypothetical protein PPERSA_07855 [Pseudocohnilembus persalinus]|eukprot:KRW99778.1 hypothetical protein PPERSA_07855 [Pseudocohnilembus persalinus]